jgi:phosphoglycerate kinase
MIELKKEKLLRFNQDKIRNKNVLVRVDFNVNFSNGKIFDKYRILSVKETLNFLKPAKKIVLISHFGDPPSLINAYSERINTDNKNKSPGYQPDITPGYRPDISGRHPGNLSGVNPGNNNQHKSVQNPYKSVNKYSFKKILPLIEKLLKIKIGFLKDLNSKPKEKFSLLENIRIFKGEKECDLSFAQKLSSLGEVFIFEAFSVAHRKHSSVYLLPKILPTYYGFNFEQEIMLLNKVLKNINNCALVLGGAKISTKLPLIKKFLNRSRLIILGGGLSNTFLKAKGFEIGKSFIEKDILKEINKIHSPKILVPFDFYVLNKNKIAHRFLGEIQKEDIIYDIGEESLKVFLQELKKEKNIILNGPFGFIENKNFQYGTSKLIKFLSKLKNKFILIGGGDTLSFLEKIKLLKKFHISTGGGAMLYYLATEQLWTEKK